MTKHIVLISVVALLVVVGLLPLLTMFGRSVVVDGQFNLDAYQGLLNSKDQWVLLWHSVVLSFLTTLLSTAVGLPLGIFLGKTDIPFRRSLIVLFTIPLLIPPYVMAISWFHLLGREGLVSRLLGVGTGAVTSRLLFGLGGCVLVLSSVFMPVVMLLTIAFLRSISPRWEEAGRSVTGWFGVIKGITVPLILPGVLLSSLLVFLLALGEFGVPHYLRYNVFPVETFSHFSAFYDFRTATAAAVPLAAVTLLALIVERLFLRKKTYRVQLASQGSEMLTVELGRFRAGCAGLVGLLCLIIVVLPLSVLLTKSMTLDAYRQALERAGDSLARSLLYAAMGASLLSLVGFFCGYIIHNKALPLWLSIDSMTVFFFALPSTVIGIGLVLLWNRPATNFVYATPVIILTGYVAQYCALTSRTTVSALAQIPASMEEAAQVVGAGWIRRLFLIVAPLAKDGLLAGWLIAYIFCLRDTGISMLVYPPGHDTLPVRTFTLMANGPSDLIAALCIIMVAGTLLPLGVLVFAFRERKQLGDEHKL